MNPFDLVKNFQEIQSRMTEMQGRLKDITVTGISGGDMVQILMNGQMEVLDVVIAPEIINPDDPGMLEDLVLAAITDAQNKIRERLQEEVGNIPGLGAGFPGLT